MKKLLKNKRIEHLQKLLGYSSDKKKLAVVILLRLVAIGLSILPPFFYKLFIDNVLTKREITIFAVVIVGYLAAYGAQMLNSLANTKVYTVFLIDITRNLKKELLKKFFAMRTKTYNKNSVGDKKNIIENDIEVVDNIIGVHFLDYYYQYIYSFILFLIMLILNWQLTVVSMIMVPLSFKFAKFMSRKAKRVSDEYRKLFGEYEGFVWGEMSNYKEVKSNCLEEKMVDIFRDFWKRMGELFVKQHILWFANRTFVSFKDFFIVKMNLYFIGGVLIVNGHMELATLLVFLNYYTSFFNAISVVMDSKVQISAQEVKMERVTEILDYQIEETKPIDITDNRIVFDKVSFRYDESKENVLKEISLTIDEKQKVSFVGKSGCGKTSLINLIYRLFEPDSGTITIGGTDISQIDPYDYGGKISVVLQNPCFFHNSIRYNLLLANQNASEEQLYHALEIVGLKEFVLSCREKIDTIIGENGIKLSGGQRQRLALCRAILKDTDVIILDEATSALDSLNEAQIMKALNEIAKNKTIISVSHRLSTVYKSDMIYVLDEGTLVAKGNHEELKNNCKSYCELFGNQFGEVEAYAS